ncbi:MAG: hypothetical protein NDJ90_08875 [Oligoflexia bacterium]|nr:hypothetical protein [Oligoflexia bacterium]
MKTPKTPKSRAESQVRAENWAEEYQAFLREEPVAPPRALEAQVHDRIHELLSPRPSTVFAKLSGLHLIVGGFSLLACPQLGVSAWGSSFVGLMGPLMAFGPYGCMLACGIFFLGASALAASMVLRPEELRVVRRHRLWNFTALGALSFMALMAAGGEGPLLHTLIWFAGSIAGGAGLLELGWKLRFEPTNRAS